MVNVESPPADLSRQALSNRYSPTLNHAKPWFDFPLDNTLRRVTPKEGSFDLGRGLRRGQGSFDVIVHITFKSLWRDKMSKLNRHTLVIDVFY